jgi:hypothetical protein
VEGRRVIQLREKVRRNSPQYLEYQFCNNTTPLDLTDYTDARLEAKVQGKYYVLSEAEFMDRVNGKVKVERYKFMWVGVWDIQFFVVNPTGDRVYGEPMQFTVVKNVDDLDLDQITDF